VDFIFYAPTPSLAYRDHIICHELGHLLFEHTDGDGLSSEYVAGLLPGIDPSMALHVLGRESYSTRQERQAEVFARLVVAAVRRQTPRAERAGGQQSAADRCFG
jgi:hypothetical protein